MCFVGENVCNLGHTPLGSLAHAVSVNLPPEEMGSKQVPRLPGRRQAGQRSPTPGSRPPHLHRRGRPLHVFHLVFLPWTL